VRVNGLLTRLRRLLRRQGYWSLAGYAKGHVKRAVSFIFDFEESVIHAVRGRHLDGVICGHIHSATIKTRDGLTYANCGDWVDSCTAIVEHLDGRLELIAACETAAAGAAAGPAAPPPQAQQTPTLPPRSPAAHTQSPTPGFRPAAPLAAAPVSRRA